MAEKIIKGVVGSVNEGKTTPSGWKGYVVTLVDGTQVPVSLPPDLVKAGVKPENGKETTFVLAKFDKYFIQTSDGDEKPSDKTSGEVKPTGSTKDRNSYWEEKSTYEEKIRDPKIESQFYFKTTSEFYTAALPYLNAENRPTTVAELDDYINQAYDKATALYQIANKK